MARPMHIYASAFSRRERTLRAWRRRRSALLPAALGALTGVVVLAMTQVIPTVLGSIL